MKYVEIYKLQNDGREMVIATCRLTDDGFVRCEGDEPFVQNLTLKGIEDYSKEGGENLYPKDGIRFLEALGNNFRSGYLMASEIKE